MTGLIAIPCRPAQASSVEFYQHLHALALPPGWEIRLYPGFFAHDNRTTGVREARAAGAEWIFILEDDVLAPPDTLIRLLAHRRPIVSVNMLAKDMPWSPYLFEHVGDAEGVFSVNLTTQRGLLPVAACGLGGILIQMSVFDRLEEPWFAVDAIYRTDDLYFCDHVEKAGIPLVCDLETTVEHSTRGGVRPVWNGQCWETSVRIHHGGEFRLPAAVPTPEYQSWREATLMHLPVNV